MHFESFEIVISHFFKDIFSQPFLITLKKQGKKYMPFNVGNGCPCTILFSESHIMGTKTFSWNSHENEQKRILHVLEKNQDNTINGHHSTKIPPLNLRAPICFYPVLPHYVVSVRPFLKLHTYLVTISFRVCNFMDIFFLSASRASSRFLWSLLLSCLVVSIFMKYEYKSLIVC